MEPKSNWDLAYFIPTLAATLLSQSPQYSPLQALLVGLLVEGARIALKWIVNRIKFRPNVQARFHHGDPVFDWLMCFLLKEKLWTRSRVFSIVSKTSQRKWAVKESEIASAFSWYGLSKRSQVTTAPLQGSEHTLKMAEFIPHWDGDSHLIRWRDTWIDISEFFAQSHDQSEDDYGHGPVQSLRLTFFTMDPSILSRFVDEMRQTYIETMEQTQRVIIHLPHDDTTYQSRHAGAWGHVKSKPLRPLSTISLEPGILDSLLIDIKDFLDSENWYTSLGIPHRRGILLWGPPGTGKTSTIYGVAGELKLEIYTVSLSSRGMDDRQLELLAAAVPKRSIFLIEDIDCAFPSREDAEDGTENRKQDWMVGRLRPPKSWVTMSGLLNVLDGIQSDDGRLFFATTNYPHLLDSALMRPGRIDHVVEYGYASSLQIRLMFNHFFPEKQFKSPSPDDKTAGYFIPLFKEPIPLPQPLSVLANTFVSSIPPREFTTAQLQGYLLGYKCDPAGAAYNAEGWVESEKKERQKVERSKGKDQKNDNMVMG